MRSGGIRRVPTTIVAAERHGTGQDRGVPGEIERKRDLLKILDKILDKAN